MLQSAVMTFVVAALVHRSTGDQHPYLPVYLRMDEGSGVAFFELPVRPRWAAIYSTGQSKASCPQPLACLEGVSSSTAWPLNGQPSKSQELLKNEAMAGESCPFGRVMVGGVHFISLVCRELRTMAGIFPL
jgi:hypothetical protein